MRKIFIAIILFNLFFASFAFSLDIPLDLTNEINDAMDSGKLLFDIYSKGPAQQSKEIDEAKNKIQDFCDFEYKPYIVKATGGDIVYFIAETPQEGAIVFGKHFKIVKNQVVTSTTSCFATQPPPENVVGAFVTHLLSETPTEFHVFLSLKHQQPMYVGTSRGNWKVENGKIEFYEERK